MHTKSGSQKELFYFIKEIVTLYLAHRKSMKFFHNEMSIIKPVIIQDSPNFLYLFHQK